MKHNYKCTIMLLLFFISIVGLQAQEKIISGKVTNDSHPLPGVGIIIKNTTTGTQTDFDGNYTIKASQGSILVFSFLGMKTVEKTVGASNALNIQLEEDSSVLDEIVIVGYGTTTKQSFTGSVKVVTAAELEKKNISNISQALSGEIAGVDVMNTSGQPGSSATIRIRGFGSVNGNRDPLYVVDGVPFSGALNSINPGDVESTTILKDATATAIYGSRGANGVVLITTRSGKSGKNIFEVDVKTGVNFRSIANYDVITSPDEYMEIAWDAMKNSNPNTVLSDVAYANANLFGAKGINKSYNYFGVTDVSQIIDPTTGKIMLGVARKYTPENWEDFAFQGSIRTEANIKLSGGNSKTNYFSSFGYLDDIGYITNSSFKRYSTRLSVTHKPKEWLTAKSNIGYTYGKTLNNGQSEDSGSVFWFVNNIPSIYPLFLRDAAGNIVKDNRYGGNQYDYGNSGRSFGLGTNGVGDAQFNLSQGDRYSFNGNFSLQMDISEGLKFETRAGIQYYTSTGNSVRNPFYGVGASSRGSLYQTETSSLTQNFLNMFNYSKDFGDHNFTALLAHESNQTRYLTSNISKNTVVNLFNGLTNADNYIVTSSPAGGYKNENALESIFGQLNYGYQHKYYVSGSLRRDGSSRFTNHKWGTFGSVGASWVVSNESFLKGNGIIDFLKLKGSYGLVGDQAGVSMYSGQNTYTISNLGGEIALSVRPIQDPNLTWEVSKMFQTGMEFTLFNNVIDGSVEYYIKDTSDLIFDRRIGPSIGDALITSNEGGLRNAGLEFDLTGHIINSENFKLNLSINGEVLKNELTLMPVEPSTGQPKTLDQAGSYGRSKGHSLYDFYIREWAGVDSANGNAQWNQYYHDANNNGILDAGEGIKSLTQYQADNPGNEISKTTTTVYANATEKYIGKSVIPKVRGAFKLKAQVYGFDFSAQFAYSLGGYSYDGRYAGLLSNAQSGSASYHVDIRDRWKNPGDISDIPRLQSGVNSQVNSSSSRFITSSDYLALNNLRVGYTIPKDYIEKSGLSDIELSVSGDNLFLFSERSGFDPRTSETGAQSMYTYSPLTTITFGVRAKF